MLVEVVVVVGVVVVGMWGLNWYLNRGDSRRLGEIWQQRLGEDEEDDDERVLDNA